MAPPTSPRTLAPAPSSGESASAWPLIKPANTEQAILEALARLGPSGGSARALLESPASAGPGLGGPGESLADPHAAVAGDVVVTAVRRLPAAAAMYAPMPEALDRRLVGALATRGIRELYTHQAETMAHALAGRSTVVVTPTASGKTLCYNGPVLDAILKDPSTRALYLYPTKALAQDQLAELHGLVELIQGAEAGSSPEEGPSIGVFTYDGDTPQDARRAIRTRAHIVLSNPDMLHAGVLPHHPRWAKLFENLRFVVIDELHAYRGVFGSHLANIMRRLQRVCRHYGSSPVFVCTSATIANPVALAERLTETSMALVDRSGAPRAEKFFAFVNPPVVNSQLGIRRSYLAETRRVTLEFLRRHLQAIVFAQSRLATEILTTYLKEDCQGPPGAPEMVRGYRGGYLPLRRREIERGLREGSVRAVVSTSALELGIDIGALDASIMAGYPGTIAATWQRAGRAGRRAGRSAAVLVASSAPLDQFMVRHPDYFFGASPEHALVNPDNLQILLDHIKCAAFELPFQADERFGREDLQAVLGLLGEEGFVHQADGQWNWTHESYPADAVSLRSVSSDNFVIVDVTGEPRVIGETDFISAPSMLHEKAIYILEGQLFHVERFDFDQRKAYVKSVDCDYYTTAIKYSKVTILDDRTRTIADASDLVRRSLGEGGAHGEVHVVARVIGFKKIRFYTNENVGSGELDLPEQQMHTTSWWLTIPLAVMAALPWGSDDKRDGVSGLAHAMGTIAPLLLMCDRQDLGVSVNAGAFAKATAPQGPVAKATAPQGPVAKATAPQGPVAKATAPQGPVTKATAPQGPDSGNTASEEPTIFLYDNYPGGIGFSAPLFEMQDRLLDATAELIAGCECERGCPSCVGPIGEIGPRGKRVALELLERLTGAAFAKATAPERVIVDGDVPF